MRIKKLATHVYGVLFFLVLMGMIINTCRHPSQNDLEFFHDHLAEVYNSQNAYTVRVHVKVTTKFFESTLQELVAEIKGSTISKERVVLVSHIDNSKPGANNNASGVGTHAELAAAIAKLVDTGEISRPLRTLTFLFGAEREGSRLWIEQHKDNLKDIISVLNADMTGAHTELTGGIYLMERLPDPSKNSPRP